MNRSICGKLFDCDLADGTTLYIKNGKLYCGICFGKVHICCIHCTKGPNICSGRVRKYLKETVKDRNMIQEIMLAKLDGEQ